MQPKMRKIPNRTHAQALITLRTGREIPDLLRELYVEQGLSQERVAAQLGVGRMTLARWLRDYDVRRDESVGAL